MGAPPEELIVLAHGLRGEVEDFTYLIDELKASAPVRAGRVIVHAPRVNSGRTFDGIEAGGTRLAEDIRTFVASKPSFRRISLLGFSLGGIYVRYAAALLYDASSKTIAGLEPNRLILVAAPNLGVRRFGVYRFLPPQLCNIAHFVSGETGRELLLADEGEILLRISSDDEDGNEPGTDEQPQTDKLLFLTALASFRDRFIYANTKGDFMVNFGSSALDPDVPEINMPHRMPSVSEGSLVQRFVRSSSMVTLDLAHDERGCRILYTEKYVPNSVTLRNTPGNGVPIGDGNSSKTRARVTPDDAVREMAARLRSLKWTVIAVEFPVNIPVAHNRIMAMSRGAFHTWMNAAGRRVVHHLVDSLLEGVCTGDDMHQRTFRAVSEPRLDRPFFSVHNIAPTA